MLIKISRETYKDWLKKEILTGVERRTVPFQKTRLEVANHWKGWKRECIK